MTGRKVESVLRRLGNVPADASNARSAPSRRSRRSSTPPGRPAAGGHRHRGPRLGSTWALRGRHDEAASSVSQVSGGAEEPADLRGRRLARLSLAWDSERAQRAVAGPPSRKPNAVLTRDPRPARAARRRAHAHARPATPRASARRSASSTAPSTARSRPASRPREPDYPTFADGHEQALIGDAIARSHAEGRWVAVQR